MHLFYVIKKESLTEEIAPVQVAKGVSRIDVVMSKGMTSVSVIKVDYYFYEIRRRISGRGAH